MPFIFAQNVHKIVRIDCLKNGAIPGFRLSGCNRYARSIPCLGTDGVLRRELFWAFGGACFTPHGADFGIKLAAFICTQIGVMFFVLA